MRLNIMCYLCEKESVITCDWCNRKFCGEHWKVHNSKQCDEIEEEERKKRVPKGAWKTRNGVTLYYVPEGKTLAEVEK